MRVLVIGSGGREHSIVKKLMESKQVDSIFAAPGNGGIAADATCVDIKDDDVDTLVAFAKDNAIDWTIVGPEVPLLAGVVNAFQAEGLNVFGPTKEAALIEGSKDFAKAFMKKYQIPTADYQTFTDVDQAKQYIEEKGAPIVIKADGLAAGKGVVVAMTVREALDAVEMMLVDNKFGEAGSRVVIEEFLDGKEFSLMAFVNGENVFPLMPARDHKRAFDNDEGPNTGGMGAFSPVPDLSGSDVELAVKTILMPAAKGMIAEGRTFTGILYAGLIETDQGPKVIEFNARLGDPETQVVLPLLKNDLLQVVQDVTAGRDPELAWEDAYCIGTVVASAGYPGAYDKGVALPELAPSDECFVIHAGTALDDESGGFVSSGGRVLLVGSVQKEAGIAQQHIYDYLKVFDRTDSFFYRSDIGFGRNK
ncbi:phosphoribosylamine--glycine ligase [Aquibacillus koreensis]|uniref:Phosphoribosylamine--glycine ligase n=1 Tax=Aquibacillus koreensis TaxID=279446 RepID=A0A9X4AJ65_9BACI|nr:phosphoribosylamine--glycine ligase [Aquibacillus koreensis]MCT2536795.1 phosphoribosylamine--glycine ligase [Aquibacillus koreensis]MDC3421449.1 phosphoribosylamine--glycine ligase [Aquibacillus koreensis]